MHVQHPPRLPAELEVVPSGSLLVASPRCYLSLLLVIGLCRLFSGNCIPQPPLQLGMAMFLSLECERK